MIPYLRFQILKNYTLSGDAYLYVPFIRDYFLPRRLHVLRGKQTWIRIWTTNARLFMNFLLLNVAFVILMFLIQIYEIINIFFW